MTNDLDIFTPEPRRVTVGGRTLDILPLKVGKLSAFAKALAPVGGSLMAGDLATPFVHGFEHLRAGIAIGAGVEEEWLEQLDADEFLTLGVAVVTSNSDFWRRRLLPTIAVAAETISNVMRPKPATKAAGE